MQKQTWRVMWVSLSLTSWEISTLKSPVKTGADKQNGPGLLQLLKKAVPMLTRRR